MHDRLVDLARSVRFDPSDSAAAERSREPAQRTWTETLAAGDDKRAIEIARSSTPRPLRCAPD
jgi:hypothetical protein